MDSLDKKTMSYSRFADDVLHLVKFIHQSSRWPLLSPLYQVMCLLKCSTSEKLDMQSKAWLLPTTSSHGSLHQQNMLEYSPLDPIRPLGSRLDNGCNVWPDDIATMLGMSTKQISQISGISLWYSYPESLNWVLSRREMDSQPHIYGLLQNWPSNPPRGK